MASEQEKSVEANAQLEQALAIVFQKLKDLETNGMNSYIFPSGINSIDLEVESNPKGNSDFRIALKISGVQMDKETLSNPTLAIQDETSITFNSDGHRTIAAIAMQDLDETSPQVATKVRDVLNAVGRSVSEAATFPDDIRRKQPNTGVFHFIDIPLQDGGPTDPEFPNPPHVVSKIKDFTDVLIDKQVTDQEMADALSWIFHLFGDIHQPLHCAERFSELHPAGDRGGNSFKLKGKAKNLHSAWDSSINVFQPEKDEDELAQEIRGLHTRQNLPELLNVVEPETWARAGFKLAKDEAYTIIENPQNPPQLSNAYMKNMEKIGQRQAALAGYRLSDHLKHIFK